MTEPFLKPIPRVTQRETSYSEACQRVKGTLFLLVTQWRSDNLSAT